MLTVLPLPLLKFFPCLFSLLFPCLFLPSIISSLLTPLLPLSQVEHGRRSPRSPPHPLGHLAILPVVAVQVLQAGRIRGMGMGRRGRLRSRILVERRLRRPERQRWCWAGRGWDGGVGCSRMRWCMASRTLHARLRFLHVVLLSCSHPHIACIFSSFALQHTFCGPSLSLFTTPIFIEH